MQADGVKHLQTKQLVLLALPVLLYIVDSSPARLAHLADGATLWEHLNTPLVFDLQVPQQFVWPLADHLLRFSLLLLCWRRRFELLNQQAPSGLAEWLQPQQLRA